MDLLLLWGVVKVTYEIVSDYVKNGTDGHEIFFGKVNMALTTP